MTVRLKIMMKHQILRCCCCGGPPDIWREKPPEPAEYVRRIADLVSELERRYGNRVDISVEDPSDMLSLWTRLRYRVRFDTPAWILEGEKIFEGVPDRDQLFNAIDSKMGANLEKEPTAAAERVENPS